MPVKGSTWEYIGWLLMPCPGRVSGEIVASGVTVAGWDCVTVIDDRGDYGTVLWGTVDLERLHKPVWLLQ